MIKYKLLKDMPTIKAGTIFVKRKHKYFDDETYFILPLGTESRPEIEVSLINDFDEWFEEVKDEPKHSLGWEPEKSEEYCYITEYGDLSKVDNRGDIVDRSVVSTGNVFKTEGEAKLNIKKLKYIRKIHKYMREHDMFFEPDWTDDVDRHMIEGWDYNVNQPSTNSDTMRDTSAHSLVFLTKQALREIKDKFAKELRFIFTGKEN